MKRLRLALCLLASLAFGTGAAATAAYASPYSSGHLAWEGFELTEPYSYSLDFRPGQQVRLGFRSYIAGPGDFWAIITRSSLTTTGGLLQPTLADQVRPLLLQSSPTPRSHVGYLQVGQLAPGAYSLQITASYRGECDYGYTTVTCTKNLASPPIPISISAPVDRIYTKALAARDIRQTIRSRVAGSFSHSVKSCKRRSLILWRCTATWLTRKYVWAGDFAAVRSSSAMRASVAANVARAPRHCRNLNRCTRNFHWR